MQRLEEIAEEIYLSSSGGKSGIAKPQRDAVRGEDTSAASEAAAEEGSHILTPQYLHLAVKGIHSYHRKQGTPPSKADVVIQRHPIPPQRPTAWNV